MIFQNNLSPRFINLHTHSPTGDPEVVEIENVYFGQETMHTPGYRSVGLHPWHLRGIDLDAAERWLRELAVSPEMLAIGEAGLDKVTDTPWEIQLDAFGRCLRVAADTGKPLIVHCVRAFGEIVQMLGHPGNSRRPHGVVFHGFDKHPQTAGMLLRAGCSLSFGAALFREDGHAAEALRQIPADRFFLETDVQKLDIRAVYARAAEIREISVLAVQEQVWENFRHLFL
ncbi:MAG: TatD family hydrolase [Saprospiraceae bacterium]|jgi:TatD DNase family protein|nr:TatD family hydrolase [Saprospiraceae bacterium]